MTPRQYEAFLASKVLAHEPAGLRAAPPLAPALFPFQRRITEWALEVGRAAVFAECGLGKTAIQLEWARCVAEHTGRPVLVLTPLAVAQQTVREGEKFGVPVRYVRCQAEASASSELVVVTNYDRLGAMEPDAFAGVVLDESSILKAYMGVTKRALVRAFSRTPFRLACTATPAPNDHVELGNHAEFLGALDASLMLSRFFINDTSQSGVYRLKRHAARDFWRWVASWAVCAARPSDIPDPTGGRYSDDGFDLPPLELHQHTVGVDHVGRQGETGELFVHAALSATELYRELRRTSADRARQVAALLEQWQRYASPVWTDIDPTDVLNVAVARDDRDEKHLCPLQLEVIRRAVTLWTNPGEVVFSPFAGIGSEGVVSLELGRRFIGAELNPRYWTHACRHLDAVHRDRPIDLFESLEVAS